MTGRPRCNVICEDQVGVYHTWTRTIRGLFLCGVDPFTGRDVSYRKEWISQRLEELAQIFAVDACVWAVLSNHYHLIVRNRPDLSCQWSDEEVARRWWMLCPERKDDQGRPAQPTDLEIQSITSDSERIAEFRRRLSSISWFMKSINEWVARRANAEDGQQGHFWQRRFDCRNLLDEGAILACSIYIDLNEIRAELAQTPENSTHTSAYRRILARLLRRERAAQCAGSGESQCQTDYQVGDPDYWMCPLDEQERAPRLGPESGGPSRKETPPPEPPGDDAAHVSKSWRHGFLPLSVEQYLELLDWTGRQLVAGKRGTIDERLAPILERVGLRPDAWLGLIEHFQVWCHGALGRAEAMLQRAVDTGRQWIQGTRHCREAFL